jgi:hypothetical protein
VYVCHLELNIYPPAHFGECYGDGFLVTAENSDAAACLCSGLDKCLRAYAVLPSFTAIHYSEKMVRYYRDISHVKF